MGHPRHLHRPPDPKVFQPMQRHHSRVEDVAAVKHHGLAQGVAHGNLHGVKAGVAELFLLVRRQQRIGAFPRIPFDMMTFASHQSHPLPVNLKAVAFEEAK